MQFLPYSLAASSIASARQYEEDVIRLLLCLQPDVKIAFTQLDSALLHTGLSPRLLYEHASAGRYTPEMAQLDAELGLPVKPVYVEEIAPVGMEEYEYIMQRLIDMGKEAPEPLQPVKPKQKVPYYAKNKNKWWK